MGWKRSRGPAYVCMRACVEHSRVGLLHEGRGGGPGQALWAQLVGRGRRGPCRGGSDGQRHGRGVDESEAASLQVHGKLPDKCC